MGASPSSETPDAAAAENPSYHTFRIREIATSVTEEQLKTWLASLSVSIISGIPSNIRLTSLAPRINWKAATVTFGSVLKEFQACTSGQSEVMAQFGDIQKDFLIDRDFYGITPLYSSAKPSFE